MRHRPIIVILALALSCCGSPSEEPAPVAVPGAAAWPEPVGGPSFEPRAPGPGVNRSEEERAAWLDVENGGTLLLKVQDAESGAPIPDCNYYAFKHTLTRDRVDRHLSPRISHTPGAERPDGIYRYRLGRGWHRLRIVAAGYRNTWTPVFEIRRGEETRVALLMKRSNRLVVTVLDEKGEPLEEGALALGAPPGFKGSMVIRQGRGEQQVDVDELTIEVGTVFLEEYAVQRIPVTLEPGQITEIEIRLTRR